MPQKKVATTPKEERRTTSVKISPTVWKEFKKFAIDKDMEISTLLELTLKEKMEAEKRRA